MSIRVGVEAALKKENPNNIFLDLACPSLGITWTADREETLVYEEVSESVKTQLLLGELRDICETFVSFPISLSPCFLGLTFLFTASHSFTRWKNACRPS